MKQKISNHVKNNWQEYASVILMLFIITVAMIYKFNLFNFDITYPIAYSGGDDLSMLVDAKMFSEQGLSLIHIYVGVTRIPHKWELHI